MPLPIADFNKFIAAQREVLHLLGVPGFWAEGKDPNIGNPVTVGVKTVSWNDEELVNSYGLNARIFTIDAAEVPVVTKFDTVEIGSEKYVLDAAVPVYINAELVFWKGIVRGD